MRINIFKIVLIFLVSFTIIVFFIALTLDKKYSTENLVGKKLITNKIKNFLSPGMQKSHYAPSIPIRLNAKKVFKDEALLTFGKNFPKGAFKTLNLSENGDLEEAASNFFSMLHKLEKLKVKKIAVSEIPNSGLGIAINDRLSRAAY